MNLCSSTNQKHKILNFNFPEKKQKRIKNENLWNPLLTTIV